MSNPADNKAPFGISSDHSTSDTNDGNVSVAGSGLERRAKFETQGGLSPQYVQLIAIGRSIGTGLFVNISSVLLEARLLFLILSYLFWGILFIELCYLYVTKICAFLPIYEIVFKLVSYFINLALGFIIS
jgi:amino acid permease